MYMYHISGVFLIYVVSQIAPYCGSYVARRLEVVNHWYVIRAQWTG